MSLKVELTETTRKTRSVSFMDETEEIQPKTLEYSDETDALIRNEWRQRTISRPRMTSVFHMTDKHFSGGIVTRANYMTRCFQTAWQYNMAGIPCLKILLWNGESSRQTMWVAIFGLVIQWVIPLIPIFFFVPHEQNSSTCKILLSVTIALELLMLIWHVIVTCILIQNQNNWKKAWFTFEVPSGTIGLVDSGDSQELTLFHFSANIRFIKVNFATIQRLHTISKHEQEILEQDINLRKLTSAEIILYTEDFIDCYSKWPKIMTFCLLIASILSFGLAIYLLACLA